MNISAKVIEDSISSYGKRITTLQITLPKVLLAEFNTHRVFSRSFSSSRAIPTSKLANQDHFEPLFWGENQAGMQSRGNEISDVETAKKIWNDAVEYSRKASEQLSALGLHKQWANRLNDWHIVANGIVTSTEWDNFFELRAHPDAQPEIQCLAVAMKNAMAASVPTLLRDDEWHLPYVHIEERSDSFFTKPENRLILQKISAARCCRVSYNKHDGGIPSIKEDIALFERLAAARPAHLSPLEHQATPLGRTGDVNTQGNFKGWTQFRKIWEQVI